MAHARQQILAAIATQVTGLTGTGANVFLSRVAELELTELPALLVQAGAETVEASGLFPARTQTRRLRVDIIAAVRGLDGLDAALNDVFAEVEVALAASLTGLPLVALTLTGIERPTMAQRSQPVAQAALIYEVLYVTSEDDPTVTL